MTKLIQHPFLLNIMQIILLKNCDSPKVEHNHKTRLFPLDDKIQIS